MAIVGALVFHKHSLFLSGIYEIQNFHVDGVDLKIVGKHLKEITKPGALLVGSFYSIVGDLSSGMSCLTLYHTIPTFNDPKKKAF